MTEYEINDMNKNIEAVKDIVPEKPILFNGSTVVTMVCLLILTIIFLANSFSGSILFIILSIGIFILDNVVVFGSIIDYKRDMKIYNENMNNLEKYRETAINNIKGAYIKHSVKLKMAESQFNNIPKCPTCNSTDISDISTVKRAVGVATVGLASSDLGKTRKCNHCGYKW